MRPGYEINEIARARVNFCLYVGMICDGMTGEREMIQEKKKKKKRNEELFLEKIDELHLINEDKCVN